MTTARIARLQALSGLAFAFFLTLHLATTASGVGGERLYDGTLAALRRVYRPALLVEIVLIAVPALVHVACAVAQIKHRLWLVGHAGCDVISSLEQI